MRQVDLDELTYQLFSGLGSWTWSVRQRVFAPLHKRSDADLRIAADKVCERLRIWTFIDPAAPDEIVPLKHVSTMLSDAIPAFPGAISALWLSRVRDREKEAQAAAAVLFAEALSGLEVLSETSILHFDAQRVIFPELNAPAYAFGPAWP